MQRKQQQTTINTVSAICGAGKSQAFINHINNFPFDRNYIYCVPTLALAGLC